MMTTIAAYCHALEKAARPLIAADPAKSVREAAASIAYEAGIADLVGAARAAGETLRHLDDAMDDIHRAREELAAALLGVMAETGLTSVRIPWGTWYLRDAPPRVIVTDESALPPEFLAQPPPRPDLAALRAALRAGRDVPGAILGNGGGPSLCYRPARGATP
jgi:hypothetical protein